MKFKKVISALAGITAAAGMLAGFAATANAATTTTELQYTNEESSVLNTYQYAVGETASYTLAEGALADVKAGDTLTIEYKLNATEENKRYRHAFGCGGYTVNVNALASDYKTSDKGSWKSNGYYLNGRFGTDENQGSATVKYVVTFGENDTASMVASITDHTNTYTQDALDVKKADLSTITLKLTDRNTSGTAPTTLATITDFKATLTTTTVDPEPVEPTMTDAERYDYTNDSELAEPDAVGFVATINGLSENQAIKSLTWYLKKSDTEYKEFTSGKVPEVTGSVEAKIGLIIYDLGGVPADEISAGYSYE